MMREATIHIPHRELDGAGIGAFVSRCLDAGLRNLDELACQSDGCLFVATVDDELPERELADLDGIEWWERLATDDDRAVYLCKLAGADRAQRIDAVHDLELSSHDIQVDDTGIDVSIVGTQDALARSIAAYEARGIDVVLQRITDYAGPRTSLDAMTDRQREVLEAAYELGYFEMPRQASATDVAVELELDPSTVTEHLRRAERNLLSELLAG